MATAEEILLGQQQGEGIDPALILILEQGTPGSADSYLLLRREMLARPQQVKDCFARYKAQLRGFYAMAAQRNKNLYRYAQDAETSLQAVSALDTIGNSVSSVPVFGQVIKGLLDIAEGFVRADAEMRGAGIAGGWGGVVTGSTGVVATGYSLNSGLGPSQPGGYWCQDLPVLSFAAPIMVAKLNATPLGAFGRANNGLRDLAVRYPYGAPFDPVDVANEGTYTIRQNGQLIDLTLAQLLEKAPMADQKPAPVQPSGVTQLNADPPPWIEGPIAAVQLGIRGYHDGYYGRPIFIIPKADLPDPSGWDAHVADMNTWYERGRADKAAGKPDKYLGEKGYGEDMAASKKTDWKPGAKQVGENSGGVFGGLWLLLLGGNKRGSGDGGSRRDAIRRVIERRETQDQSARIAALEEEIRRLKSGK